MKRKLALILCVVAAIAMIFTLASCGEEKCEHTYSADWSSDENGHWNAATCGCEGEISNYGIHADEKTLGEDGKLTAGKDGLCDTCSYKLCKEHTYATEWSTNETNHWNAATCGCDVKANDAEHVDENKDGNCDECKYVICDHSPVDAWSSDETYHWKETDCKDCNVDVALKGEHADENEDGRCDTCGYVTSFDYVLKSVIEGLDSEAWFGVNSSVVLENGEETFTKIFDNYTVVKDAFGNTKYYSYYGENDANLFVVYETDYGTFRNIDAEEIAGVAAYEIVFYKVVATNHEDAIKGLYSLAMNGSVDYEGNPDGKSYGLVSTIDEEAGKYSFKFLFTIYESAYEVSVEFEVDADKNAVKSATITIDLYDLVDVTIDEENLTYTVNEDAEAISTKYEITQTFGDPMSSEETPNPHPASKYIIDDLVFVDENTGTEIKDGDIVEIFADYANGLSLALPEDKADLADFQLFEVTTDMMKGWLNYPVLLYSNYAGEYAVEITNGLDTISFTVKVSFNKPQTMGTNTINVDSGTATSESEVTMYNGQSLMVNAVVSAGCDPTFTAEVTVGEDAAIFTQNENGTYTFKPLMVGDYEIKLTSSVASDVTATLKVTVIDPPTIEELLDGEYEGTSSSNWIDINAEFGAESTVVITLDGVIRSWDYETMTQVTTDVSGTATYTYVYNAETGALALTKTEGDDLIVEEVYVENYKVVVQLTNDWPCKLEKVVEEPETPAGSATESPIKVTMTGAYTYCYDYEFTFVAGEAGAYTFTVPVGFGVISQEAYDAYGSAYVDFQMDQGGTFTLDLDAGESVALRFGSTEAKEYELAFTYSASQGGGDVDEPDTPASGSGTQADPFIITESGNYVADYVGGGWTVFTWYQYTATADGNVVFTYTGNGTYWLSYGTNPDALDGVGSTAVGGVYTIPVTAGDVLFLAVQEYNGTACEIPFTVELPGAGAGEDEEPETTGTALTIGNNAIEAADVTYTYTAEADGKLSLSCGNAIMGPVSITCTVNGNDAGEVVLGGEALVLDLKSGDKVVITVTASGYATLNAAWVGESSTGNATLNMGNTSIEAADATYEYTASADETLVLSVGTAVMGPVTVTYSVNGGDAVTLEAGVPANVALTVGDKLVVNVTATGYATLAVTVAGGEADEDEPDGSMENPYVWETLPEELTFTSDATNKTYYTFTATESGVLTITYAEAGDSWADLYAWANGEWDGQNSQSASMSDAATFNIVAGTTYRLGISTWSTTGETTVTIAVGEGNVGGEDEDPEVEDPQAELKGLLSNYTYKIGEYNVGLTQSWETGVYYINVTDADWTIDLGFTYELTDNGDGTFTIINLASYDMGYASGADQADAVKAAVEGQKISANLTNNAVIGYHQLNGYQLALSRNTETGAYEANISDDAWTTDLYFTYVATENEDGTFTIALTYTQVDWEAGSDKVDSLLAMDWVVTLAAE
ncbi:MAG: hypothetical protein IJD89_05145 [Clostridia bacterium]|nr:hypothetical protein [Clostridia bacterium]